MPRTVMIIGEDAEAAYFLPIEGAEIWGLNAARPAWVPYWSRMFNLHSHSSLRVDWAEHLPKEEAWVRENPGVPFYVGAWWPRDKFPSQVRFETPSLPLIHGKYYYHRGSIDLMVLFAVTLGFQEIKLHGVKLSKPTESPSARACLEYWCGYAEGLGVRVETARDCDLLYGVT